jgi:hypothetical protein
MEIEIYDRKSGEVIETKSIDDLKSFLFYWSHQCNTKEYNWKEKQKGEHK